MNWSIPALWKGETCFVLAGGPSLSNFDADVLAGLRVVTINDSWKLAPRADLHYFCDERWWVEQHARNPRSNDGTESFRECWSRGETWLKGEDVRRPSAVDVRKILFSGQLGLDRDPSRIRHGSNSGYQAIHVAYHLGCAKIVLLGYDMHCPDGRTHWHDGPRAPAKEFNKTLAKSMLPIFPYIAQPLRDAGVVVLNATPNSKLTSWPKVELASTIETPKGIPNGRSTSS